MTNLLIKIKNDKRLTAKLSNFIKIKHGFAFKGEYFGGRGTHVVVTPGNFFEEGGFRRRENKDKWYSGPIPKGYVLERGDLIVAMTEQGEGLLGSSAIIPTGDLFLHNQRIGLIEMKSEHNADKLYLYYLFNSRKVRNHIQASASGTKVKHTSPDRISGYEHDFPSLTTQKKIAAILNSYDAKIENNSSIIKNLESMAQNIFNEWFVKFHFPGYQKVKFVDSEIGEVPEGWELFDLKDIFTFIKGKKPSEVSEIQKEGFIQQILIDSFGNGKKTYADKRGMVIASEEDLLMVMDGASSGRVEFGISGVVGSTISKLHLLKPIRSILYFFLKSKERDVMDNTTGSAIPHTDKEKVQRFKIALPRDTVLFEEILFRFVKTIKGLHHENVVARELRDQLFAKLM